MEPLVYYEICFFIPMREKSRASNVIKILLTKQLLKYKMVISKGNDNSTIPTSYKFRDCTQASYILPEISLV